MSRVWLFNLDADDELARPENFSRRESVRRRIEALVPGVASLLRSGDAVLSPEGEVLLDPSREVGPDDEARLWCPTPTAIRRAREAGLEVEAPPLTVLQRVNHRSFAVDLAEQFVERSTVAGFEELPGSRFAHTPQQALEHLESPAPEGGWLLKRAHGYSGTAHRRLRCFPEDAERRWMEESFGSQGGLHVEPFVDRETEFVMHGFVDPVSPSSLSRSHGAVRARADRLAGPHVQRSSPRGAWVETRPARDGELNEDERRVLCQVAEQVAEALSAAGYFGPFGVDAFRWRDSRGVRRLRALSEINARHTTGWGCSQDVLDPA